MDFWLEYIFTARQHYDDGLTVSSKDDPMLAAFYGWFKKIDDAVTKAETEHCTYFECRLIGQNKRLALRFRAAGGKAFVRTLPVTAKIMRGRMFALGDLVDMKVALQSQILGGGRVVLDPKAGHLPL